MKVKDPYFVLERAEKYLQEDIRPSRIRNCMELRDWEYCEFPSRTAPAGLYPGELPAVEWKPFTLGESWGGYDKTAWFRRTLSVPAGFQKHRLALRFLVGPRDGGGSTAETLLIIDGKPVQAVDIWHEEVFLDDMIGEKQQVQIVLKAWSGVVNVPAVRCFREAQLLDIDMKVDRFYFVLDTLRRCIPELDEHDLRRIRLLRLVDETLQKINYLNYPSEEYYQSVYRASDFLQREMSRLSQVEEIKPVVYGVGHSHIDMGWLWRVAATREKASRTFSTVLHLMEEFPDYQYMHSSPQLFQFLQRDYPEIFQSIRERVRQGRFEITGGMWVESDTNLPSGESLIRQFLFGKRYVKKEFGKTMKLVWLPDVFGYSGNFPQIMKKCGMKYFSTTKISWNQYNVFPHDTFWWRGIDGTEIFTHFVTTPDQGSWYYTYIGHMDPEEITGVWKNYKDKDKNDRLLISYGWGDGGGGPTREMIAQAEIMKNIPGIPYVKLSGAEEYFEDLYRNADKERMAHWDGELYFELHRGTYTSQAENKLLNRRSEELMHNIEFMSVMASLLSCAFSYPQEEVNQLWETILLNQFHDILPGSSIRQVYEDTKNDYQRVMDKGRHLLRQAELAVSQDQTQENYIIWNTTGVSRREYIKVPYSEVITRSTLFSSDRGDMTAVPEPDGLLVYTDRIPPYTGVSCRVHHRDIAETQSKITVENNQWIITPHYKMKLSREGEIAELYDRDFDKRVDIGENMNVFRAYEDKPQRFDAWDIDVFYKQKPYPEFQLTDRKIILSAEKIDIRQTFRFNLSTVVQDIVLTAQDRRIDFHTHIDWRERQVLLKVYFPVNVFSDQASYEIQYGVLRRPTCVNTEYDFARFEVCGHRFGDISEADYGVALLNDAKYGYDIHQNILGLTLLKSSVSPDETADRHMHDFTYSLLPHAGDLDHSEVQDQAIRMNIPLLVMPSRDLGKVTSLLTCSHEDVIVDTIKKAEDDSAVIIRLYERANTAHDSVAVTFHFPVARAEETNLCEENPECLLVENNTIHFSITHYEIKTFKIWFMEKSDENR